jgi:hypothetical protein
LEAGEYLIDMLMEAGPIKPGGMGGSVPLDWLDVQAYASLMCDDIADWEALLLVRMSQAFALGLSEGTNPFSIPPIDREDNNAAP